VSASDRARCALTILLQSLDSFAGYLCGIDDGELRVLAGLPEGDPDPGLYRWAEESLAAELDGAGATATATAEAEEAGALLGEADDEVETSPPQSETDTGVAKHYIDNEGRCFEPLLLVGTHGAPERAAALLLVQYPAGPRVPGSRLLLGEIADLLLNNGDVRGSVI
jgi:hypothetical protein